MKHLEEVYGINRNRNGEDPPKHQELRGQVNEERDPSIVKVFRRNCSQPAEIRKQLYKRKTGTLKRKLKHEQAARIWIERVEQYNLLSSLPQAHNGINIGKIFRGAAKEAEAVARLIFRSCKGKRALAAVERRSHSDRACKEYKSDRRL